MPPSNALYKKKQQSHHVKAAVFSDICHHCISPAVAVYTCSSVICLQVPVEAQAA